MSEPRALDFWNRLCSIAADALYVECQRRELARVLGNAAGSGFVTLPNMRCGGWYARPRGPDSGASAPLPVAYFQSKDGHHGQWTVSPRRANLGVLDLAAGPLGGCLLVDATASARKVTSDALAKTVPFWCAVMNRTAMLLGLGCRGECPASGCPDGPPTCECLPDLPGGQSPQPGPLAWDYASHPLAELHTHPSIEPTERDLMRRAVPAVSRRLIGSARALVGLEDPLQRILRALARRPLVSTWLDAPGHFSEALAAGGPHPADAYWTLWCLGASGSERPATEALARHLAPGPEALDPEDAAVAALLLDGPGLAYDHVRGAGDDHELWSDFFTPELWWAHRLELLAAGPGGCLRLARQLELARRVPATLAGLEPATTLGPGSGDGDGDAAAAPADVLTEGRSRCAAPSGPILTPLDTLLAGVTIGPAEYLTAGDPAAGTSDRRVRTCLADRQASPGIEPPLGDIHFSVTSHDPAAVLLSAPARGAIGCAAATALAILTRLEVQSAGPLPAPGAGGLPLTATWLARCGFFDSDILTALPGNTMDLRFIPGAQAELLRLLGNGCPCGFCLGDLQGSAPPGQDSGRDSAPVGRALAAALARVGATPPAGRVVVICCDRRGGKMLRDRLLFAIDQCLRVVGPALAVDAGTSPGLRAVISCDTGTVVAPLLVAALLAAPAMVEATPGPEICWPSSGPAPVCVLFGHRCPVPDPAGGPVVTREALHGALLHVTGAFPAADIPRPLLTRLVFYFTGPRLHMHKALDDAALAHRPPPPPP
ncbi:hypothetical protein H696_03860 [Fonticula alba]|uniref:Rit1 N-terminal domain-containing protein n=1 Tax=Fonticula alba TaxID=691883 RepID=A0A058Z5P9_FONAL|nr:hypothetical protein H696_03860 [Fonticula alba]KCV69431.1 hypothetical protein H696_03860 [Fonticula alba]|eukprot:XP_009495996.1 hypothetical protein H696_03860 [Fonticula alba]